MIDCDLTLPQRISQERFQQYCSSKGFSPDYLEISPLLMRSLTVGVQIAACHPVRLEHMFINDSLTGVLQGVLDAVDFFREEVDEHAAIQHVATLLSQIDAAIQPQHFERAFEYFGSAFQRRLKNRCDLFPRTMIESACTREDGRQLQIMIGMHAKHGMSLYVKNTVLEVFCNHPDARRLVEIIGSNDRFGEFCIRYGMTEMTRYLDSRSQRGRLMEQALGM